MFRMIRVMQGILGCYGARVNGRPSRDPASGGTLRGAARARGILLSQVIGLLSACCCTSGCLHRSGAGGSQALQAAPHRTRLVLLGTGTPNAEPERSGPALAIVCGEESYLVDAGPGVVRRAAAAAERYHLEALRPKNLRRVFLTHLHSDHTCGLPDLIFTPWVLERAVPLQVFGPPGTREMCDHLLAAYREDVELRLHGLEQASAHGWQVDAREIGEGEAYRDENVRVIAFAVKHGSWAHAFGFRFETADRVIVVSGDTAVSENLMVQAKGCDILVHEVYSDSGFARRPARWQAYHSAFHTSARQLGELAARVRPGLLVLTHQLYWGTTEAKLIEEVHAGGYHGSLACGRDLDAY